MNTIDVIEWYDGEVQFLLGASGSYFYGFCVEIDFENIERPRTFVLIPISAEDKAEIEEAVSADIPAKLNNLLPGLLEGRQATFATGSLATWDAKGADFSIDTTAYKPLMKFPLIDILAGINN